MFPELYKHMHIRGMKQKDLAKLIGVTQQAVGKKLRGETQFKLNEMQITLNYFRQFNPALTYEQLFEQCIFLAR